MEKRVLDFAVNSPFAQGAERWSVHYPEHPISENLLRRVTERVGLRCESTDNSCLQHELLQVPPYAAQTLVVATDGSMLPMRGDESWKEAKVAVIFREEHRVSHSESKRGQISRGRYIASLGGQDNFSKELAIALALEGSDMAERVVWLGDGAPCNWTLATELAPKAQQILDWGHAIQKGVECGKVLLGDDTFLLTLWKRRIEDLVFKEEMDATIEELMSCIPDASSEGIKAINDLVRYFRNNQHRMRYKLFVAAGLPIGSGFVESAHRHVLQTRMKCSGQHWSQPKASRMVRLRAAYRTAGPIRFHAAINAAANSDKESKNGHSMVRHHFPLKAAA